MTSYLWILLSAAFVISRAQDLDLADAFDDLPTAKPGPPQTPKPPKKDGGFDLSDALGPDVPSEPKKPTLKPSKSGGDFDLPDALDGPPKRGGGGFSDSDLTDLTDDDGYKPDPNKGGRAGDNTHDSTAGDAGQTKVEGGQMAAIISSVAVAIFGAASSYIAYQKKKLCFKSQGGGDLESGRNQSGAQSEPQTLSSLLKFS